MSIELTHFMQRHPFIVHADARLTRAGIVNRRSPCHPPHLGQILVASSDILGLEGRHQIYLEEEEADVYRYNRRTMGSMCMGTPGTTSATRSQMPIPNKQKT